MCSYPRVPLCVLPLFAVWTPASAENDPPLDSPAQRQAPTAFADDKPVPVLNWGEGVGAPSVGYPYLGQTRSGAVDWRPRSEDGPGRIH